MSSEKMSAIIELKRNVNLPKDGTVHQDIEEKGLVYNIIWKVKGRLGNYAAIRIDDVVLGQAPEGYDSVPTMEKFLRSVPFVGKIYSIYEDRDVAERIVADPKQLQTVLKMATTKREYLSKRK